MPAYSHFDYYLRALTTAVLALVLIGVSAYEVIHNGTLSGPFVNWTGIVIGVYFGAHVSMNGSGARRRVNEAEVASQSPPLVAPAVVVHPATPNPPAPPD